jgi:hypothetical protein
VKVGRAALDEDAIRRIEESNPTVEFDWTQILKGQSGPPPAPEVRPSRPGRYRERPPGGAPPERRGRGAPGRDAHPRPAEAAPPTPPEEPAAESFGPESITIAVDEGPAEPDVREYGTIEIVDELPAGDVPAIEGAESSPSFAGETPPEPPPTAAHARLGPEGVLRLRARYAEVLARISERVEEPVRREELKAQAERLNPDTWVTADEVTEGIEQYESVFETLRSTIGGGRRQKRRRRGRRATPRQGSSTREAETSSVEDSGGHQDPAGTEGRKGGDGTEEE